jgi:hypothetical protein
MSGVGHLILFVCLWRMVGQGSGVAAFLVRLWQNIVGLGHKNQVFFA